MLDWLFLTFFVLGLVYVFSHSTLIYFRRIMIRHVVTAWLKIPAIDGCKTSAQQYSNDTLKCQYNVPKEIDFPRYNMKCSWENVILRGIFHVVSSFPLHFILYRGNFDSLLDSVPHMQTINLRPEHCVVHALLKISKSHILLIFHHAVP